MNMAIKTAKRSFLHSLTRNLDVVNMFLGDFAKFKTTQFLAASNALLALRISECAEAAVNNNEDRCRVNK